MKQNIFFLYFVLFLLLLSEPVQAIGLHRDYIGNIGKKEAGLTITVRDSNWALSNKYNKSEIKRISYFYKESLEDINLEIRNFTGRNLVLAEYNKSGELIANFELSFVKKDPQNHFSTEQDLDREVLVGNRISNDKKGNLPVYFVVRHEIEEMDDGGRCGPNYHEAEKRIQKFYYAVLSKNLKTLNEFGVTAISDSFSKKIAESMPHNLFCNYKGIMLNNGVVWFDDDGNLIKINHP
ncbi:MAG: hypothetical protein EBS06_08810 [Proteobacteria bacterium]|nr:hypothetical protein [Pseudomonadota bacterium]